MLGHTIFGKAQGQEYAHGKEEEVTVSPQTLEDLVALVPVVISLNQSPSLCICMVLRDTP